ncbi:hypothetical protein [Arthrobacter koreensis]|uniref:hypothetical protein n=1 Tax=Arthrobacter koreensis TaxID=199136 RepID=UPI00382167D3
MTTSSPRSPIQKLGADVIAAMRMISSGVNPSEKPQTIISFMGIAPDDFTSGHRDMVRILIDKHGLGSVLEITQRDGNLVLIDRATQGRQVSCELTMEDEAMASFDDAAVPGTFVYALILLLAVISDTANAEDPEASGMFIDFSRKGHVLWADTESEDYQPFDWSDVNRLLTL